jgi:hypothetical protein
LSQYNFHHGIKDFCWFCSLGGNILTQILNEQKTNKQTKISKTPTHQGLITSKQFLWTENKQTNKTEQNPKTSGADNFQAISYFEIHCGIVACLLACKHGKCERTTTSKRHKIHRKQL